MFGFIVCGIQASALEHEAMKTVSWNAATGQLFHSMIFIPAYIVPVGLILAYTAGKHSVIFYAALS
jgi:hypothetical protein